MCLNTAGAPPRNQTIFWLHRKYGFTLTVRYIMMYIADKSQAFMQKEVMYEIQNDSRKL